ncbi:monovalent cation/H(+) antiporter subunit G, partial [Acinetobacter baumannii]|uniref:cation:proton antiporter n=1 Tax=Acinetobacter baumannii TaxID=470 RepID=UPI003328C403
GGFSRRYTSSLGAAVKAASMSILTGLSWLLLLLGLVFFIAGSVGLLRFPDQFSRLHAVTKADTLGLGLVVLGLSLQSSWRETL